VRLCVCWAELASVLAVLILTAILPESLYYIMLRCKYDYK
jgi:hypothetical protein